MAHTARFTLAGDYRRCRVLEPIRITRRPIYLTFVLYTAIHLLFMLPLKFYSLATVNRTGWGTR